MPSSTRMVDQDLVDAYMARRWTIWSASTSPPSRMQAAGLPLRRPGAVRAAADFERKLIETRAEYRDVIATLNDGKSQQLAARLTPGRQSSPNSARG